MPNNLDGPSEVRSMKIGPDLAWLKTLTHNAMNGGLIGKEPDILRQATSEFRLAIGQEPVNEDAGRFIFTKILNRLDLDLARKLMGAFAGKIDEGEGYVGVRILERAAAFKVLADKIGEYLGANFLGSAIGAKYAATLSAVDFAHISSAFDTEAAFRSLCKKIEAEAIATGKKDQLGAVVAGLSFLRRYFGENPTLSKKAADVIAQADANLGNHEEEDDEEEVNGKSPALMTSTEILEGSQAIVNGLIAFNTFLLRKNLMSHDVDALIDCGTTGISDFSFAVLKDRLVSAVAEAVIAIGNDPTFDEADKAFIERQLDALQRSSSFNQLVAALEVLQSLTDETVVVAEANAPGDLTPPKAKAKKPSESQKDSTAESNDARKEKASDKESARAYTDNFLNDRSKITAADAEHVRSILENDTSRTKVEELQSSLNKNGASLKVDGRFGPNTRDALMHDASLWSAAQPAAPGTLPALEVAPSKGPAEEPLHVTGYIREVLNVDDPAITAEAIAEELNSVSRGEAAGLYELPFSVPVITLEAITKVPREKNAVCVTSVKGDTVSYIREDGSEGQYERAFGDVKNYLKEPADRIEQGDFAKKLYLTIFASLTKVRNKNVKAFTNRSFEITLSTDTAGKVAAQAGGKDTPALENLGYTYTKGSKLGVLSRNGDTYEVVDENGRRSYIALNVSDAKSNIIAKETRVEGPKAS